MANIRRSKHIFLLIVVIAFTAIVAWAAAGGFDRYSQRIKDVIEHIVRPPMSYGS